MYLLWMLYFVLLIALAGAGIVMVIGLLTSQKEWTVECQGHLLRVENRSLRETLYVDGEIQDQCVGYFAFRAHLTGRLPEGGEIKVHIGAGFRYHCNIFVDNRLIYSK